MKKVFTIEEIVGFVNDHIKQKTEDELLQILKCSNNIEAFKEGLFEGIINGIECFCGEKYHIEGIEER